MTVLVVFDVERSLKKFKWRTLMQQVRGIERRHFECLLYKGVESLRGIHWSSDGTVKPPSEVWSVGCDVEMHYLMEAHARVWGAEFHKSWRQSDSRTPVSGIRSEYRRGEAATLPVAGGPSATDKTPASGWGERPVIEDGLYDDLAEADDEDPDFIEDEEDDR